MDLDEPSMRRQFASSSERSSSRGGSGDVDDAWSGPLWLAWRVLYPMCLCLVNFCLVIGGWLWLKHPLHLYRMLRWLRARRAGLRFRSVRLDGTVYRLAEKGLPDPRRSSLLLVHSVGDDCTAWTDFVGLVDPQLDHVIAVDLPGHGGSLVSPGEDFDPGPLAARLRGVLAAAELAGQPVHAVGYSAGACVALAYAAAWPDQTELLTLAAPLLLLPPPQGDSGKGGSGESEGGGSELDDCTDNCVRVGGEADGRYDDALFDSDLYNWLLPWDPDLLASALRHRAYRPLGGSQRMRRAWLEDRLPRLEFHRALLANLTAEPNRSALLGGEVAGRVRAPTQIVWGLQDEISPVSCAQLLQRRLPSVAQSDILDECGHSMELECPEMLYNLVYKFRKNQSLKKFN